MHISDAVSPGYCFEKEENSIKKEKDFWLICQGTEPKKQELFLVKAAEVIIHCHCSWELVLYQQGGYLLRPQNTFGNN